MDAHPDSPASARPAVTEGAEGALVAVGVYQLLGPLLAGRSVVEIGSLLPDSQHRLERAGASQAVTFAPEQPSLPMADAAADVVLCLGGLPGEALDAWLAEIRRILQPEGMLVVRAQRAAEVGPGGEALRMALAAAFGRTDLVMENAFVGVSFFVPDTEDIAIGGDLDRLAARPTHELLFCAGPGAAAPLTESLLIPLDGLRAELTRRAAWQKAIDTDRDELREQLMALQERSDRADAALAELRRRSALHLERSSDTQEAVEALTLERDQAVARAERAEKAIIDQEAAARRREVEVSALKSELTRLRARLPPKPDPAAAAAPAKPSEKPPGRPGRNDKGSA